MKYEGFRLSSWSRVATLLATLLAVATLPGMKGWRQRQPAPPPAHRVEQVDVYHGVAVADPYRWLEILDAPDTRAFAEAQDQYTREVLNDDPRFAAYRARFLELQAGSNYYGAQIRGDRVFYIRTTLESGSRPTVMVMDNERHRALIDSTAAWPTGTTRVGGYAPDRAGRRLALSISNGPSTPMSIRVQEVDSGELLDDQIVNLLAGESVTWSTSGEGFYYTSYAVPPGGSTDDIDYLDHRVMFHRLGNKPGEDLASFTLPEHPDWRFRTVASNDGRALVITAREPQRNVDHLYFAADDAETLEARRVPLPGDSTWTYVDNDADRFIFLTQYEAPRGRLVQIDASSGEVTELVAESNDTLNNVQRAGDHWLATYIVDARREIHVFDRQGRHEGAIELPGIGGVTTAGHPDVPFATVQTRHVGDPGTIWEVDPRSREVRMLLRPETSINADDYVIEQAFVTSKDGTRVPVSMVRRRDLDRDGTNPVFLYGYGAWSWSAFPYFQTQWHLWVELGGIFAVPNIRGGGEYGEAWHQAGIKLNKANAFDDMIAAAEWFATSGWSAPGRIVANGGSASGLLAAAVAMRRPDLFGGAVIDHPGLDLLRSQAQPGGQFLVPEYGSVEDPDEFKALRAISPYHNVRSSSCYPPMLVTVGEADRSTAPMHGLKYIAAVQYASACDHPALLEWVPNGGHLVFGTSADEQADILSRQLVFARRATEGAWR